MRCSLGKMAWRNLWRNPRRSLVTMATMAVALCALVVFSRADARHADRARAQRRRPRDRRRRDLRQGLRRSSVAVRAHRRSRGAVAEARSRRLSGDAAAARQRAGGRGHRARRARCSSASTSRAIIASAASIARSPTARGSIPRDAKGVVIGRRLAKSLGLEPGGEILLLTNAADGSMANELYRVRGVLRGMGDAIDRGGVFMNAGAWRTLLVVPDGAHQIIVRRPAQRRSGDRARHRRQAGARRRRAQLGRAAADAGQHPRGAARLDGAHRSHRLRRGRHRHPERDDDGGVRAHPRARRAQGRRHEAAAACSRSSPSRARGRPRSPSSLGPGAGGAAPLLLVHHGVNIASLAGASVQGVAYNSEWHAEVDRATFTLPDRDAPRSRSESR